jgi:ACS family tartrate transporter-like MFS transporter
MPYNINQIAKKVAWRIMPLAILGYFLAYVDRINVGFAALTMRNDLGMTATAFGFATGLFFWGYALLEVPSNIALSKWGARIWLSRIMISWGIVSALTAFVSGITDYAILRVLLGIAEAGFFPGILLYFTYWFPKQFMARAYGFFTLALVFSPMLGAPISTAIMGLDGWLGLKGWQLMFILESLPTILVGIIIALALPEKPENVTWLTQQEKNILQEELAQDTQQTINKTKWYHAIIDSRVWVICSVYLCYTIGSIGMVIFLPQIIQSLGKQTIMTTGWLSSIPYIAGAISLVIFGWSSDRYSERHWHVSLGLATTTFGFALATFTMGSYWAILGLSIAAIGMYGKMGAFWALCGGILKKNKAAVGFAFINSVGNLGGFIGPFLIGWARDLTGSFSGSIAVLVFFSLVGTIISIFAIKNTETQI